MVNIIRSLCFDACFSLFREQVTYAYTVCLLFTILRVQSIHQTINIAYCKTSAKCHFYVLVSKLHLTIGIICLKMKLKSLTRKSKTKSQNNNKYDIAKYIKISITDNSADIKYKKLIQISQKKYLLR